MKKLMLLVILLFVSSTSFALSNKNVEMYRHVTCQDFNIDIYNVMMYRIHEEMTEEAMLTEIEKIKNLSPQDLKRYKNIVRVVFNTPVPKSNEEADAIFRSLEVPCILNNVPERE